MSKPKIGMTEAGDAGWDLSWFEKLTKYDYDGAILITKSVSRPEFMEKGLELNGDIPFVIHSTITGWGGSIMEPMVPTPEKAVNAVRTLIDKGIAANRFVLRIDPIYPTTEGIEKAQNVIRLAKEIIPDVTRIRVSIYDDYPESRAEICRRGLPPIDDNDKPKKELDRRPTPDQVKMVAEALMEAAGESQRFECCAEPELAKAYPGKFFWFGCLSERDCDIMDIEVPEGTGINGQQRYGCRCLMLKQELLSHKRRCPNNCAYCYWGSNN